MLKTPHAIAAASAISGAPSTAWLRVVKSFSMRPGPAAYDLASLLCDPYVMLGESLQLRLLDYYLVRCRCRKAVEASFWPAAIQRLSQALGAYGRLSMDCGLPEYASKFKPALIMMARALSHVGGLNALRALVEEVSE